MIRFFQMFVDVCEQCGAASPARAFFEGVHDEAGCRAVVIDLPNP
jgi:hypothetical protein